MKQKLILAMPLFYALCLTLLLLEAASPRLMKPAATVVMPTATTTDYVTATDTLVPAEVLRLHVVANSDTAEDQRVKLLVRDALLAVFSPANTLQDAELLLLHGGGEVQSTVERVLREQGCPYPAQLRFGNIDFPARTYGNATYPAGEYRALRVELGAAAGQNWWCVLFPPICLLDVGVTNIAESDDLVFKSDIVRWMKGS